MGFSLKGFPCALLGMHGDRKESIKLFLVSPCIYLSHTLLHVNCLTVCNTTIVSFIYQECKRGIDGFIRDRDSLTRNPPGVEQTRAVAKLGSSQKTFEKAERANEVLLDSLPVTYWGSKDWADGQLKYLLPFLLDNSTWNLPHNWHCKRVVAFLIIERLREAGFHWHVMVAQGHFHRWLKRKSWESRVQIPRGAGV